jgi:hypothetical protein
MSRRPAKWIASSKEAQTFKDRVLIGQISLDDSPKNVLDNNQDILGKFTVKQVENAMSRLEASDIIKPGCQDISRYG